MSPAQRAPLSMRLVGLYNFGLEEPADLGVACTQLIDTFSRLRRKSSTSPLHIFATHRHLSLVATTPDITHRPWVTTAFRLGARPFVFCMGRDSQGRGERTNGPPAPHPSPADSPRLLHTAFQPLLQRPTNFVQEAKLHIFWEPSCGVGSLRKP